MQPSNAGRRTACAHLATLLGFAVLLTVLMHCDQWSASATSLLIALGVALVFFPTPKSTGESAVRPAPRLDGLILPVLVLLLAVFFRFHLFWVMPLGYWDENLFFVRFAAQLHEKFTYLPYQAYFHTLLGYLVWAVSFFTGDELTSLRLTCALVGTGSVILLYLLLRTFFGARIAWLGAGLMAACFWNLWSSRSGWQKFLMPPFQVLIILTLYRGITGAQTRWFVFSAAALAVALHAYWGLYLMPLVWPLAFIYLLLFHPLLARRSWKPALMGVLVGIVLILPLAYFFLQRLELFLYPMGKYNELKGDASDILSRNLAYVFWSLSGNAHAGRFGQYAPLITILTAACGYVGLGVAVKRIREPAYALILILLFVNLIALAYASRGGEIQFMPALTVSVYTFAAIGASQVIDAAAALLPRLMGKVAPVSLGCVLLIYQSCIGYQEYFLGRFADIHDSPSDQAFGILPTLQPASEVANVFLPVPQCDRDFGSSLTTLAHSGLDAFQFVRGLHDFSDDLLVFPSGMTPREGPVEIFVPRVAGHDEYLSQALGALYPEVAFKVLMFPYPHGIRRPQQLGRRITIPISAVRRYQGLVRNGRDWDGYFYAPRDGIFSFQPQTGSLSLRGRPLAAEVFLERGYHPVRWSSGAADSVSDGDPVPKLDVQIADSAGSLLSFEKYVVHFDGETFPMDTELARPSMPTDEAYRLVGPDRPNLSMRSMVLDQQGRFVALAPDGVKIFSSDLTEVAVRSLPHDHYRWIRPWGDSYVLLDQGGRLHKLSDDLAAVTPLEVSCPLLSMDTFDDTVAGLCGDGTVLRMGADGIAQRVGSYSISGQFGYGSATSLSIAASPVGFAVLDATQAKVTRYDWSGKILWQRTIDTLCWPYHRVAMDAAGRTFVPVSKGELRVFDQSGNRMFNPKGHNGRLFHIHDRNSPADGLFAHGWDLYVRDDKVLFTPLNGVFLFRDGLSLDRE